MHKWSQWTVAGSHTISITAELRAWTAPLQVIFIVMLGHPCALHKSFQESVVHVLTEAMPSIATIIG
ncbi:hypothetical protein D3C80_1591670 [compost metagenome]